MKVDMILFPDGSLIIERDSDLFYSGYGTVVLDTHSLKYTTLSGSLSKKSIVYCEAYGIYQGLRYIEHLRKKRKTKQLKVLIVSDSKLNVDTFNWYIKYSWDLSDWYNWKKKDKHPVQNQELYRKIMDILNNGYYVVKFVHINSHSKNKKELREKISKKMAKAGVRIKEKDLDLFVQLNDLADNAAKTAVNCSRKNERDIPDLKRKVGDSTDE